MICERRNTLNQVPSILKKELLSSDITNTNIMMSKNKTVKTLFTIPKICQIRVRVYACSSQTILLQVITSEKDICNVPIVFYALNIHISILPSFHLRTHLLCYPYPQILDPFLILPPIYYHNAPLDHL